MAEHWDYTESGDIMIKPEAAKTFAISEHYEVIKQEPLIVRPKYPECKHLSLKITKLVCGRWHAKRRCKKYNKTATVPDCNNCVSKQLNQ